ncbi:carcinine hydrolase/isopenicillin-N N-acyltransferase family protein [Methanomethylophilus alvi]|uniref:carcinine hydrolase/isopenicillin-N N-acyltransferase family protein n=1 Tax=Methanomethylophilus alvi TaxID=1291540 RepID=UPI0037DCE4B6
MDKKTETAPSSGSTGPSGADRGPGNPHSFEWLTDEMSASLDTVHRVDKEGFLYEMDCSYDYYGNPYITSLMEKFGVYDAGCSAFVTFNETGDSVLTARNYDYRHTDAAGGYTGLNVAIHCAPDGRYRSVAIADAYWLDSDNATFSAGVLDDGRTDTSMLVMLPYVCVDGINEKGLTVSILKLDVKEGESSVDQKDAGKISIGHSVLTRYILDGCATVDEAVAMAGDYNIKGVFGMDFHIFVTDSTGASAVLEWRYNKLCVTKVDAVSNFYSGFDDAEDYYKNGVLMENVVRLENSVKEYKYGFGHGYHRFTGIVSALERYIDFSREDRAAKMTGEQAMRILSVAAQDPGTEATSMTQYSAVYDSKTLSATVCMHQDYGSVFRITLD